MLVLSYLFAFVGGVVFTVWLCQEELFHGRKVGYGENNIHPDKGVCGK